MRSRFSFSPGTGPPTKPRSNQSVLQNDNAVYPPRQITISTRFKKKKTQTFCPKNNTNPTLSLSLTHVLFLFLRLLSSCLSAELPAVVFPGNPERYRTAQRSRDTRFSRRRIYRKNFRRYLSFCLWIARHEYKIITIESPPTVVRTAVPATIPRRPGHDNSGWESPVVRALTRYGTGAGDKSKPTATWSGPSRLLISTLCTRALETFRAGKSEIMAPPG